MNSQKTNLVVKANSLNTALQNLSKIEIRIVQLAIVDARETNTGLSTDKPLRIDALRYAEVFGGTRQNAYDAMKRAEDTLFNRRFTILDIEGRPIKSRWLQQVQYFDGEGAIELVFTLAVVKTISRIDGIKDFFTSYLLEQTVNLGSMYSVRLYELLVQWKTAKKTPTFELDKFRSQVGVGIDEYKGMSDFKKRVLDLAVNEINEHTDLNVEYENVKKGRPIIGFKFKVLEKSKLETKFDNIKELNGDLFTIEGLSDKQIWRITRHKEFISTYNVIAKGDAAKSWSAYSECLVNEIKKDPSQFSKKRPIREYLDKPNSEYDFSQ